MIEPLLLRNAWLPGGDARYDVLLAGGVVAAIGPAGGSAATPVRRLDLDGVICYPGCGMNTSTSPSGL